MIRTWKHTTCVSRQVLLRTRLWALVGPQSVFRRCMKQPPCLLPRCFILPVQHFSGEGCTLVWLLVILCNPVRWAITSVFSYNPGKDEKKRESPAHTCEPWWGLYNDNGKHLLASYSSLCESARFLEPGLSAKRATPQRPSTHAPCLV